MLNSKSLATLYIGVKEQRKVVEWRCMRETIFQLFEGLIWRTIVLKVPRSFLLGTFYRPPKTSNHYDKEFMTRLEIILGLPIAECKEIIITWDLNCDLQEKRQTSAECTQLRALFKCFDFIQLINKATPITEDSETLLDIIATNCSQNISASCVISASLNDHDMVFCVRKINSKRAPAQIKEFRNYGRYDHGKFCQDLETVDWDTLVNPMTEEQHLCTVNEQWLNFKTAFLDVGNQRAPFNYPKACSRIK